MIAKPGRVAEQPEETASGFQTARVLTIAGGHFVHDTFSAFIAPLLPILQEKLATNYALTGSLAVYIQVPSLLNPFIGYLADKVSLRYFIILAPGVTGTLMSSLGLASDYLAVAMLLLVAGVSVAAFHAPAPAMIGRVSGRQIGKGMSIFMASGELGRTLGPIVAVGAVSLFGLQGIWRMAAVGWLVSLFLFFRLQRVSARPELRRGSPISELAPRLRQVFPLITWLLLGRVLMVVALTTFLPIYMRDERQSSLWLAAASLTILEAAGVIGALVTGTISDRIGRSRVLVILLSVSPFLFLALIYGPGWLSVPLLVALGLTAISPTPVILAVVQDQFPENRALANGIFLALSFSIRAIGTWVIGVLADQLGLTAAFLLSGVLALLSVPAARKVPEEPSHGNLATTQDLVS